MRKDKPTTIVVKINKMSDHLCKDEYVAPEVNIHQSMGPFTNYVMPLRWVGGQQNINIANSIRYIFSKIIAKT